MTGSRPRALQEQFASEVLYAFAQPDEVRRELFGMSPEARGLIVADLAAIQAGVSEQPADAEQVVDRCVVELDSERRVNGLDADRGAELADKIVARYVVDGQIVASDQAQNGAVYTAASWAVRACRTAFDDLGYTPKEESEDFRALDLTVLSLYLSLEWHALDARITEPIRSPLSRLLLSRLLLSRPLSGCECC